MAAILNGLRSFASEREETLSKLPDQDLCPGIAVVEACLKLLDDALCCFV